jgi:two-component system NtrC family sensor kinase
MKKLILCIFLIFYIGSNTYSQNKAIDSLKNVLLTQKEDTSKVNTLHELGFQYGFVGDFEKSLDCAKKALVLSEKLGYKKGELKAYLYLIDINQRGLGNQQEAMQYCKKGIELSEKYQDDNNLASFYLQMSYINSNLYNSPEALNYSFKALKIFESSDDKINLSETYNSIAILYRNEKKYSEALNYFKLCLKLKESLGTDELWAVARTHNNIGKIYLLQNKIELALQSTLKGLNIFKKLADKAPNWGLPYTYNCMASIYEAKADSLVQKQDKISAEKEYKNALDFFLKSQETWESIRSGTGGSFYVSIGNIYLKLKQYQSARINLSKAIIFSKNNKGNLEGNKDTYLYKSKLDSIEGKWKDAYYHYKLYTVLRDSFENTEKVKANTAQLMQFEFDKKEALAKAQQEKKDLEHKRTRNLQYAALAGLILIVSGLFYNNHQKQKAKTEIEKAYSQLQSTQAQLIQKEKLASLGELTAGIAHEIQNPLNFVNNFSELSLDLVKDLKEEIEKPDIDKEYVGELFDDLSQNQSKINHHGKRASSIVKGMLEHSRASTGDRVPTDLNKLADEYLRLSYHGMRAKDGSFNADYVLIADENLPLINVVSQDIGRVLLNLINNAFWAVGQRAKGLEHGGHYVPKVMVSTKMVNNQIIIKVSDNGAGIPADILPKIFQPFFTTKPTGEGTGLGLSLSYDIVTKGHGGTIEVESVEGEKTTFVVKLPFETHG